MNMEQIGVECNSAPKQTPQQTGPYRVIEIDRPFDLFDRATQIRNLAIIGFAARDSVFACHDLDSAYLSLFEVIARLAAEIEGEDPA